MPLSKEQKEQRARISEEVKETRLTSAERRKSEAGAKKGQITLDKMLGVESQDKSESSIESIFKSLEKRISHVPSKDYMQTEFSKMRKNVEEVMCEKLDELKEDLVEIFEKEIESVKSLVTELEGQVGNLSEEVVQLKNETSYMKTDIDKLTAEQAFLKEKNNNLTEKY